MKHILKIEGEKSEKVSEEHISGDTLDKLIDSNSLMRRTKKKIMNEPNSKRPYYVKPPYPILNKKSKK